MREILFRAKRLDNGEWVVGYLLKTKWAETGQEIVAIIPQKNCIYFNSISEWVGVDPETVSQYTGLTDNNGKKIFEGDIVESEFTQKPYPVCFGEYTYTNEYGEEESACGWYNEEKGGYVTAFGCPDAWATVIGNIHDNPELLEVNHV